MQNRVDQATYPWFKIWVKPKESLRTIFAINPKRYILFFSLLNGVLSSLLWFHTYNVTYPDQELTQHPLSLLLFMAVGASFGLLNLYVGGWLFRLVGSWLGGKGSYTEVKCAIGWNAYLYSVVALLGFPHFLLSLSPLPDFLVSLLYLIALIWAFILWLNLLSAAHQFSILRAFFTLLLIFLLLLALFLIISIIASLLIQ